MQYTDAKLDAWLNVRSRRTTACSAGRPPRAAAARTDHRRRRFAGRAHRRGRRLLLRWAAVAKLETAPGLALVVWWRPRRRRRHRARRRRRAACAAPARSGSSYAKPMAAPALTPTAVCSRGGRGSLLSRRRRGAAPRRRSPRTLMRCRVSLTPCCIGGGARRAAGPQVRHRCRAPRAGSHARTRRWRAAGGGRRCRSKSHLGGRMRTLAGLRRRRLRRPPRRRRGGGGQRRRRGGRQRNLLARGSRRVRGTPRPQLYAAASGAGASYVMAPLIDSMNHDGWSRSSCGYSPLYDAFEVRAAADGCRWLAASSHTATPRATTRYRSTMASSRRATAPTAPGSRAPRSASIARPAAARRASSPSAAAPGSSRPPPPPRSSRDAAATRRRRRRRSRRRAPTGAAMPTTLADDEATLQSGGSALPTRRRLALQWRIEKKRILARVAKG